MTTIEVEFDSSRDFASVAGFVLSSLVSLLLPLLAFVFLRTGPHEIITAICWILPFWLAVVVDIICPPERRSVPRHLPDWPFTALVYILAGFHSLNIYLVLELASLLSWENFSACLTSLINLFAIKVIVGTSASFSGIVVAHELIHRPNVAARLLGRFLLSLECYEHFYTEHVRGHHRNVGTSEDPATARFGESFNSFWRRTVPGQFKSAWRSENRRLNVNGLWSPRMLYHRVFQGLLFEFFLVVIVLFYFGAAALAAFLLQALAAVRKLEAVNYFEHWGLNRQIGRGDAALSWDTDSWFTLHSLVGLSRHADHHRNAATPYQRLEYCADSPQLPYGYFGSVFLTVFMNSHFRRLAADELKSRGLGPFQKAATSEL